MIEPKKKQKLSLKRWVIITIMIVLCAVLVYSLYKIFNWYVDSHKAKELIEEVIEIGTVEEVPSTQEAEIISPPTEEEEKKEEVSGDYWEFITLPFISVNFDKLKEQNKDTVAWLFVNNTNINYPVVQARDNKFYLNRAFDKTTNSGGWLFMDYRNNAKDFGTNTIIYGHSLLNTTMFGTLIQTKYPYWYKNKNNHVIKLSTPKENTLWQIFSIYVTEEESYYITTEFYSDNQRNKFFTELLDRSIYNFKTKLNSSDKILTLSTCADSVGNTRLVVHAKLIKKEAR